MSTQPDGSATATLEAAREHARQQAAAAHGATRTIPSRSAVELPHGVVASTVMWDEIVGSGQSAARLVPRDVIVRLSDIEGDACVQLLVFNAHRTTERLNPMDTVKVQWQAYLGEGALLLSDMGRVLMTITDDTSMRHDCLCGGSNRATNTARYGDGSASGRAPNSRDMLSIAAAKYGLGRVDIGPCVNLFKSVRVGADGSLSFDGANAPAPAASIELRAETDVIVVMSNTPHPLDERAAYSVTPVRVVAWRADRPTHDPLRDSTPERGRAFENTDEMLMELAP